MKVWVEIGPTGLAIQIFRTKKAAVIYAVNPNRGLGPEPNIREMPRELAVGQIRRQIFERDERRCVHCGKELVWERGFPNSMEMDERQARGSCQMNEDGVYCSGQISVSNSQTLCKPCHTGPGGKQDRSPSFSKTPAVLLMTEGFSGAATLFVESYAKYREGK